MIRLSPLCRLAIGVGALFLGVSRDRADEVFREVHNEPIIIRVLHGRDGKPLSLAHLTLLGGYDDRDLQLGLWRTEALTNEEGVARLPGLPANLPFLRVWVTSHGLCHGNPKKSRFSVELIRNEGLSAPNHCGTVVGTDTPGFFTVFVKGRGVSPKAESQKAESPKKEPNPPVSEASGASTVKAASAPVAPGEAGLALSAAAGKAGNAALRTKQPVRAESSIPPIDLASYFGLTDEREVSSDFDPSLVSYPNSALAATRPRPRPRTSRRRGITSTNACNVAAATTAPNPAPAPPKPAAASPSAKPTASKPASRSDGR